MTYLEERRADSRDIKGSWIVVLLSNLGLILLTL